MKAITLKNDHGKLPLNNVRVNEKFISFNFYDNNKVLLFIKKNSRVSILDSKGNKKSARVTEYTLNGATISFI
ncbi:hypothetical protein M2263_000476 [Providencia alcalifaciens]|nr:hypothetical protein [Providencia alcalifaciens]